MKRIIVGVLLVAALAVGGAYFNRTRCLGDPGPKRAVEGYLGAMKAQRFEDAYDFVTATMTDGKPRDEWAGVQRKLFQLGAVELGDLDVRAAHNTLKNPFLCADRSIVPNVLRAKDRFNNQGSTEYEIYTVLKEGGAWKIDSQETLFDEPKIHEWFPGEVIPEFKEQL